MGAIEIYIGDSNEDDNNDGNGRNRDSTKRGLHALACIEQPMFIQLLATLLRWKGATELLQVKNIAQTRAHGYDSAEKKTRHEFNW